jgi:RNA polymerase sigma factor (sigma-70 family)
MCGLYQQPTRGRKKASSYAEAEGKSKRPKLREANGAALVFYFCPLPFAFFKRAAYAVRVSRVDVSVQSDEQLVAACRRGEGGAWEALVNRYQRLIYAIPRRAGLDEDAAAEVFQEVFTTLVENIDSIEQPSRLQAWLVTTAKRKSWRTISRARAARPFATNDDGGEGEMYELADEHLLPDEVLVRLEQQHLVRAALPELGERCQQLLTMLFYQAEPPPYSEIAAALGTSEGSIGPTRARCLKKLLEALKQKGFS